MAGPARSASSTKGHSAMPYYRVTLTGKDRDAMLDLTRRYEVEVFPSTARERESGSWQVDAILESEQIDMLRSAGYEIDQHEDVQEAGLQRQAEVQATEDYRVPEDYYRPEERQKGESG
jgi:hypothetical protein